MRATRLGGRARGNGDIAHLVLMRRSWTVAGLMFVALLAESVVPLHCRGQAGATVPTGARADGAGRRRLPVRAAVCRSAGRVWRLSAGARRGTRSPAALAGGIHQYKIRDAGVAWKAPDGSAVFLPGPR